MTFEERVERIVDKRFTDQLSLMQDATDRTSDLLARLDDIHRILPLIRDIKTEIDQIQKRFPAEPQSDEESDENEPYDDNRDLNPDDLRDLDDFLDKLDDLEETLKKGRRLKFPNLKSPFSSDTIRNLWYLYNVSKDLNNLIKDSLNESIDRRHQNRVESTLATLMNELTNLSNLVDESREGILSSLESCCDQMQSALSQCCSNMGVKMDNLQSTVDSIDRAVQDLDPSAMPNKDLSLQSKTRAILAEIQAIRGLL